MDELRIEVSRPREDTVVIAVGGFIDTNTATTLEKALREHTADGASFVVVDLSAVDYVSSAGWGVMVSVVNHVRDGGGDMCLAGLRPEVDQIYRLLEFPAILAAHRTVDEALAAADG